MPKSVKPKVFLIGGTVLMPEGLAEYLRYTRNQEFLGSAFAAKEQGLCDAEVLTSFNAKLCYASLTEGHNKNVAKVRSVFDNLMNVYRMGHGSVLEHGVLNFVATDVSRVLTHELVRHRVGTAFSQTSGRYVRGDEISFVEDPILDPVSEDGEQLLAEIERVYARMCDRLGLNGLEGLERQLGADLDQYCEQVKQQNEYDPREVQKDKDLKKKLTSALRRYLPNGQANEIGFSLNLRAIRHTVMMRTSRHAEWEIRCVFEQVYQLANAVCPTLFHDAKTEAVECILEVSGMTMQPY